MLADPANVILAPSTQKYTNFDNLIEQSTPSHATTLLFMQKLPYGFDFSAFGQWVGAMKWTTNTSVRPYQRIDLRLGYPFRAGKVGGEIALTAQSIDGLHGEFDMRALATDRLVDHRNWVSLRLDF
jgi:iron complex outermembrane receptor protein